MIMKQNNERKNLIDEYTELTNRSANDYNESYRNLSNALMTASSIYMAVIAAIVASENSISSLCILYKIFLGISIPAFLTSILFGITSHMNNVKVSKQMYEEYKKVAKELAISDAKTEQKVALEKYEKIAGGCKDKIIVIIQLAFFAIGVSLLIFPLYGLIF